MELNPLFVQSLEKGLRVLEAFNGGEQYLGLAEIAARSGLEKSAAQRCTHTLQELGYLEKCPKTKQFALGKKCLDLAFYFLHAHPLVEAATPALVELRRSCGERVNLSLFDGTTLIYVIRQQGKREYFYSSLIGRRMPTFCTAGGRAMLAHLPREEMMEIIGRSDLAPLTPHTITEPERIFEKIDEAREKSYGIVVNECAIGEISVAAAVLNATGQPIAGVHIAGSLSEWESQEFERRFAPLVIETARSLSRSAAPPVRMHAGR